LDYLDAGQGFPDWATPDFAKKALIDVCGTFICHFV
jgi:hypothetical protein